MCDPLTIAGIALTAGSTVANSMAQNKVKKARADVMEAERIRQQKFDTETLGINTGAQNRYQDFPAKQDTRATELGDYFASQDIGQPGGPIETTPTSTSGVVTANDAAEMAKAKAFTDTQGRSLGNLRAFGDVLGGISREQARDASLIGQIGSFKKGSSDVVPLELETANEKGNSLKMLGDVLGIGGTVAMGAGLGGGTLPSWMGGSAAKVTNGAANVGAGPWGASLASAFPATTSIIPKRRSVFDLYGNVGR